jgi:hypothetical protein
MKTDDFIAVLATGVDAIDTPRLRRRLALVQACGIVAAIVLGLTVLKVNPHLSHATAEPMFWMREGFCLTLGMAALIAVGRLGVPGRRLGLLPLGVAIPILAVWAVGLASLIVVPASARIPLILGHTARWCPLLITLLAVAPFIGFVSSLRRLAPTRLRWAGAAAGLAAGSFSAFAYSLHCPELEPAFFAVWYVLGILIPTALGVWLGPRLLRW